MLTAQSIHLFPAGLYGNRGINPAIDLYNLYSPMPNMAATYPPKNTLAYDAQGLSVGALSASNSGTFAVTSSSPISPNGVFLKSENLLIEGPLAVNGQLPFLSTIAVEGALPAHGNGAVMYGCGNGNVGILNEEYPSVAPVGYPMRNPNPPIAPFGYPGLAGMGRVL